MIAGAFLVGKRGSLGEIAARVQKVRIGPPGSGRYGQRTVLFTKPGSRSSESSVLQKLQQTKFSVAQEWAQALAPYLKLYYRTNGYYPYQNFLSDVLTSGIAKLQNGTYIVSPTAINVTMGKLLQCGLTAYQGVTPDDDCFCHRVICWNHDYRVNFRGDRRMLMMFSVHMKQKEVLVGNETKWVNYIDCVEVVETGIVQSDCAGEVAIKKCECCKTYTWVFWLDVDTLENSDSVYIGTCECELEKFDPDSCDCICILPPVEPDVPYNECPTFCSDRDPNTPFIGVPSSEIGDIFGDGLDSLPRIAYPPAQDPDGVHFGPIDPETGQRIPNEDDGGENNENGGGDVPDEVVVP